jgi:hypothetical protein
MSDRLECTRPPEVPLESDRMLRHTWLHGFDDPEPFAALDGLGAVIADYAREARAWSTDGVREPLGAIAADLDSLAACLVEVAEVPSDSRVSRGDLALCVAARKWAVDLGAVAAGIRAGLSADDGGAE